ncbi:unnamed protein product [Symbiodinium sp. KB8]|nr:unnamed protein product [Symbiodinium sp. KB8]
MLRRICMYGLRRPDRVLDAVRQKLPPKVQAEGKEQQNASSLQNSCPKQHVSSSVRLRQPRGPLRTASRLQCDLDWVDFEEALDFTVAIIRRSIAIGKVPKLILTEGVQVLWTMVAVGTSCVCGCPTGSPPCASWPACQRPRAMAHEIREQSRSVPRIAATVLWLLALPRWNKDDDRQQGLPMGVWIFRSTQFFLAGWIVDELPLWKFGFFVWTGAILAGRRGRLGAWPVLFWSIGIGHQLEMDIRSWVYLATWRVDLSHGNASDHAKKMLGLCQEQLMRFWPAPPASEEKAEEKPEEAAQEPAKCTGCGQVGRWALTLPRRKILCESCTQSLSATAEANVAAFVEGASPGLAEPLAKRPRLDPGAGGEVSYLQRLNALPGKQGLRAKGQSSVSGDLVDGVQRWPLRLHLYD